MAVGVGCKSIVVSGEGVDVAISPLIRGMKSVLLGGVVVLGWGMVASLKGVAVAGGASFWQPLIPTMVSKMMSQYCLTALWRGGKERAE